MGGEDGRSRYHLGPPWIFTGRALYQLHLVKAETARAFIPKHLKLVEAFGYTLGGMFLAHYDDSPAGRFDELVVIAGIVWNPPTSCAWAARVLVNSEKACRHGRKEIGLPSHVAKFVKVPDAVTRRQSLSESSNLFDGTSAGSSSSEQRIQTEHLEVSEMSEATQMSLCSIFLPETGRFRASFFPGLWPSCNRILIARFMSAAGQQWPGPRIKMSLPSFSGETKDNLNLLKYSCRVECSMRPVKPLRVSRVITGNGNRDSEENHQETIAELPEDGGRDRCISVLLSKPILALEFNSLKMHVGGPEIVKKTEG